MTELKAACRWSPTQAEACETQRKDDCFGSLQTVLKAQTNSSSEHVQSISPAQ